jgi:hypothetical protein
MNEPIASFHEARCYGSSLGHRFPSKARQDRYFSVAIVGDLIAAHDLGSDLAKQIVDDANANADQHLRALNAPVQKAWDKATDQTIAAFNELAPLIEVTNVKQSEAGDLVDPHEIAEALRAYRDEMGVANYQRAVKGKSFDFDSVAARNKQELKERLTRASQRDAPPPARPVY